ncbi:tyrosine-protein phosphatase [Aurantimonas sp. DM33-3]|uniref:tyrosine-protein phosphatase n=1 Tax=Aurantimonas sp. DM33-3 TaxID=2766955 RepID=UPI00165284A4|nr:tyrosine-protein phosphatase [Aurantimonas sp. DM33-3]MBC6716571.1 tyrosine-protein phosphatase [Aurantimonas sp. DM33-3]
MQSPFHMVRGLFVVIAVAAAAPASYAGYLQLSGNVHTVENATVYRSGQLNATDLDALIDSTGIRSILNLRGAHPDASWYREEWNVARRRGIVYRSIAISAGSEPDVATMQEIEQAMADAPKPLLIHCMGGSDRTGLASAIYEYAIAGKPEGVAADQLSFAYGHFPWLGSSTGAMDRAFERFVTFSEAATAAKPSTQESM